MAGFTLISKRGDRLPLVGNPRFKLIDIEGQTDNDSAVYSNDFVGADGDTVNTVKTNPRQIVIHLHITDNVEQTKRYILDCVKPKQAITLEWEQEKRTLALSGVVQSLSMPRWKSGVVMQITLHCGQPYWEDKNAVVQQVSEVTPLHYFTANSNDMLYFDYESDGVAFGEFDIARTKTFYNSGDVAVGLTIIVNALRTVTNPIIYASADKYIGARVTLEQGETLTITTGHGNKDIRKGDVSVLSEIFTGSTFFQLETGDNTFTIDSDDTDIDNMYFEIIYSQRYV